jgi:glycerol uptake facilitator-like aquaporin
VALAQGFSLAVAIYSIANVSGGHCNPAVTFALILVRRIGLITGIFYIIAQLGGGIIASLFVKSITSFPREYIEMDWSSFWRSQFREIWVPRHWVPRVLALVTG